MLDASPHAAYCLPVAGQLDSTTDTRELDHLLAVHFGWWDLIVGSKRPSPELCFQAPDLGERWRLRAKSIKVLSSCQRAR